MADLGTPMGKSSLSPLGMTHEQIDHYFKRHADRCAKDDPTDEVECACPCGCCVVLTCPACSEIVFAAWNPTMQPCERALGLLGEKVGPY